MIGKKFYYFFNLISIFFAFNSFAACLATKEQMPIQAVIFDCDGILVDTEFLKFQAWQQAAKNQGFSFTLEEYLPLVGHSGETIAAAIKQLKEKEYPWRRVNSLELDEERTRFYHQLQSNPKNIVLIEPMVALAKQLNENKKLLGYKLGLASSAPLDEIKVNLETIGLSNVFDFIISGKDSLDDIRDPEGVNKPKPYIYQRIAQWMKVDPAQCVVFEDTHAGVRAAVTAGMKVYAVPNQYTKKHNFEEALAILDTKQNCQFNKIFEVME